MFYIPVSWLYTVLPDKMSCDRGLAWLKGLGSQARLSPGNKQPAGKVSQTFPPVESTATFVIIGLHPFIPSFSIRNVFL
jgi:hypothetical protein